MLYFDSQKHVYTNIHTGEEYISATTLLNRYKKPFDAKAAAERVANREGTTAEEVQKKWKQINTESKTYGSKIHSIIEKFVKEKVVTEGFEDLIESYKTLSILDEQDEILSEEKLHSHRYKLAGTADLIRLDEKGGFSVFDIKTNKKFNFFNQYGERMLPPINHLTSCEFTLYSLQLSLYAYMYQNMTGRNVNQLGVFYYNNQKQFEYIPAIYLKTDIEKILAHYEQS